MNKLRSALLLFLKGIAMGAADVVPGVSGGTIAFITGIYGHLLDGIGAFSSRDTYQYLIAGEFKLFWRRINGSFLLVLMSGIGVSIVSFAKVIFYFLTNHPETIWSFFFGLVLVSCFYVGKEVCEWNIKSSLTLLAGVFIAYQITEMNVVSIEPTPLMVFCSGAIAICAMILPGISGSFILLTMGMYGHIIGALKELDVEVIVVFMAGNALGLLLFSRFLGWLLHRHGSITLAFLTGLLVGSLNKVWPWKLTLTFRTNSHGVQVPLLQENVSPFSYQALTGFDPHLSLGIGLMLAGVLLVAGLSFAGKKFREAEGSAQAD